MFRYLVYSEMLSYLLPCWLCRPVAGYVNLCPESVSTKPHDIQQMHSTIKHEILHALVSTVPWDFIVGGIATFLENLEIWISGGVEKGSGKSWGKIKKSGNSREVVIFVASGKLCIFHFSQQLLMMRLF